ncbi:class I SAM-dependent methyltransferase [Pseudoramibacter alactolyticus]|uniref:class I SAM-dependent methyltransferase n=1 Tax=Pseudoramibacter alactolyticus TaxID=113287 RepID=UPI0028E20B2F|nr:class I SAM-dependent methyltransferase [Pseudoramibacter alactolyticus]
MLEHFRRQTDFVRTCVAEVLTPGDSALDATVGTGEDTCFLAETVGATGRVYGFDIQKAALTMARDKLAERQWTGPVHWYHQGHETLGTVPEIVQDSRIRAAMFNLGYFPGGDPAVVTRWETTLTALSAAAKVLAEGGILTICVYAHASGRVEAEGVARWVRALDHRFEAYRFSVENHQGAPVAYVIRKKG